jgi:hypothetical protein
MSPLMSDEPTGVEREEARQELYGARGPGAVGLGILDVVLIAVAIVGGAVAFEEIDHWSQWVVLAGIIATVIGFMIAVSPARRA